MARSTWTLVTGSALVLAGCLALAGPARAETDPLIAMAVDPTPMEPVGLVQVAWPISQEALAETFGQPVQAPETEGAQLASLTLVTEPTPAVVRPAPAYRVQLNEHVRFFL